MPKPSLRYGLRPAVGKMRIVNVSVTPFDPEDESFD